MTPGTSLMHLDVGGAEENWGARRETGTRGSGEKGEQGGGCSPAKPCLPCPCLTSAAGSQRPAGPACLIMTPSFLQNGVGGGRAQDPHALAGWTQRTEGSQEEQICLLATPQFPATLTAFKVTSRSQQLLKELWCGQQG